MYASASAKLLLNSLDPVILILYSNTLSSYSIDFIPFVFNYLYYFIDLLCSYATIQTIYLSTGVQ